MVILGHMSIALSAAVAALGSALFIAWSAWYRRRVAYPVWDYCMITEEVEERREKQVLVLGLDGAGKSSVLHRLNDSGSRRCIRPTRGFNFMSLGSPVCQLNFLEIGGGEELREYWADYLRKTHILVYVVDSSDRRRLPLAKYELHQLLQANTQLPVVVLGNKQDKPGAAGVSELRETLSLESVTNTRKIFLLVAQLGSEGSCSLLTFKDLLLTLV